MPDPSLLPDDGTFMHQGIALPAGASAPKPGRVLVIACGALAREIVALRAANHMHHIDLHCLPADLHLHPDRIPPAIEAAVMRGRTQYADIFVAYADCGTGGRLQALCARLGVQMMAGPHCYAFFDGQAAFAARAEAEIGAFYLTDFLVRQFDAFVIAPLGLDHHPELRDSYFGHYDRLVYLAQTDDPALDTRAQAAAARLGLAYQRRMTGYGELATALAGLAPSAAGGA